MRSLGKAIVILLLTTLVAVGLIVGIPNLAMFATQAGNIKTVSQLAESGHEYDCIMVLGASVNPDGTPSTVLADRLDVAAELYFNGVAPKVIVSGDDRSDAGYDEVTHMKSYLVDQGIPSEDVFCDHAGMTTFDSTYRAKNVFQAEDMVIVTQTYHLYRALYDANTLGVSTVGVASDLHTYSDMDWYETREIGARMSDFAKVHTGTTSTYLSSPVSLKQSGDITSW